MIYYIVLKLSHDYSMLAKGTVTLTTTDDGRSKVLELDINCQADANLDALITAIDSNALLPTQLNTVSTSNNYCYDITRAVTDTTDLNTLFGLISALNV